MTFGHFCVVELTSPVSTLKYNCSAIFYEFHLENRDNTNKARRCSGRFGGHVRIVFINHLCISE